MSNSVQGRCRAAVALMMHVIKKKKNKKPLMPYSSATGKDSQSAERLTGLRFVALLWPPTPNFVFFQFPVVTQDVIKKKKKAPELEVG